MRFLIAPDAFKGTLNATQAAEAMAAGIRYVIPSAEIETLPLADGGEGTLDVLISHLSHEDIFVSYQEYANYSDNVGEGVALIESARHLGLTQPDMQALDIYRRGSGALGDCIRHALDAGIRRYVIGLGGSATSDAGLGLLSVLGLCAFDARGEVASPDLQGLLMVKALDISSLDSRLANCRFTILCDVNAPLYGPDGATHTFGPQKGLPVTDIESVDLAMERFAHLAETSFGRSVSKLPGSGAAGGLGFALALLGGELVSGADYVIEKTGLTDRLYGADWLITGEGRSDMQTLAGKLPLIVAKLARQQGKHVAMLSGSVVIDALPRLSAMYDYVAAASETLPGSAAEARALLQASAERFARSLPQP